MTRAALLAVALVGCAQRGSVEAPLARVDDDVQKDDTVLVRFEPRDDERWSLRRKDGSFVCTLPCSYWVPPSSGMVVKLEGPPGSTIDDTTSLAVPDDLPAHPGDTITLTVDRTHGLGTLGKIVAGPTAVVTGLMGIAFTAISVASLASGGKNTTTTVQGSVTTTDPSTGTQVQGSGTETTHDTAAAWTGVAIGAGALAVAALCTYWFFHARQGGVEVARAPSGRQVVRITPTGLSIVF